MRFQLIISICAALIPLIAVILMLPKKKSKKNKIKQEPAKEIADKKPKDEQSLNIENTNKSYDNYKKSLDEDFKRYAQQKSYKVSKPSAKPLVDNNPFSRIGLDGPAPSFNTNRKETSVIDEFNGVSDELKTLIISGILDKKDY